MNGIQVVRLLDTVTVTRAENVSKSSPRQIRVFGSDFRSVELVIINGFETRDFIVDSEHVLRVVVPEVIEDSVIMSVSVLSNRLTMTEKSLVTFDIGTKPRATRGTLRLLQNFVRLLFRTPGTNIFQPKSGGGIQHMVGGDTIDSTRIPGELAIAVRRVQGFIVGAQSSEQGIPSNERLLSSDILGIRQPDETSVEVSIQITTHAGTSAAASFLT